MALETVGRFLLDILSISRSSPLLTITENSQAKMIAGGISIQDKMMPDCLTAMFKNNSLTAGLRKNTKPSAIIERK